MQPSLFVRSLTCDEEYRLKFCVRGRDLFALRRAQMILASASGVSCRAISLQVGQSEAMVRQVIHRFNAQGVACLTQESRRPKSAAPLLNEAACERLRHLLHQCPRTFGQKSSLWSLDTLAEVAWEQGITPHRVGRDTIARSLKRLGVSWKRAKTWITSPDPHYARKKSGVTG